MSIPSTTQIANEMRSIPGLGEMQAIRRIQGRELIRDRQRASVFAPRLVDVAPVTAVWSPSPARLTELLAMPRNLTDAEMAELTAFERDAA